MNVSQPTSQHRSRVLILWASQITAFILVLLYVGLHTGGAAQLPRIFLQGTILAQCGLAVAFAVFARWQPHFRIACSFFSMRGRAQTRESQPEWVKRRVQRQRNANGSRTQTEEYVN